MLGQKEDVSFLRVIHAIEGTASLFRCDLAHVSDECLIQGTMADAQRAIVIHHPPELREALQRLGKQMLQLASSASPYKSPGSNTNA